LLQRADSGRAPVRPVPQALPGVPATADDGVEREARHAGRRAGRLRHRRRLLGRARNERPALVLPTDPSGDVADPVRLHRLLPVAQPTRRSSRHPHGEPLRADRGARVREDRGRRRGGRDARVARSASSLPGEPADVDAPGGAAHAARPRQPRRALRACRVHAGRALEHRLLRPVGSRAREGARQAHRARALVRRAARARLLDQCPDRALPRIEERNGGLTMQLGMIGLGRMGANIVRRLMRDGHECVVYDVDPAAVAELEREGAVGASSLAELVEKLETPRAAWVMVPAAITGRIVDELAELMDRGDIVIDGGNSYYRDDVDRAAALVPRGIEYVDVGTSGGVFGLERGYCLMIGGERSVVEHLDPLFRTIAPGVEAAPRTPDSEGEPSPAEQGYLHCGPAGAGHFVKMVHNGIEYGIMAAYAEGLNVLHKANVGNAAQEASAEATPLRDPQYYRYDIDVAEVTEVWRRGSVVASWLLDLTAH